jgi:hypothetical protein
MAKGSRPRVQGEALFPTLPGRPITAKLNQEMISAPSASSSGIFLSSSAKDTEKERFLFPERKKELQPAESREDAERRKYS